MEANQPTLPEKTTAMEKAIRMAKEIYTDKPEYGYTHLSSPTAEPNIILTTAKQIYDWLLTK